MKYNDLKDSSFELPGPSPDRSGSCLASNRGRNGTIVGIGILSHKRPYRPYQSQHTNRLLHMAGELVVELVSLVNEVPQEQILARGRGPLSAARSRQLVMYLLHTSLGFSYQDIGNWLSKDRTTISYACNVIEDMRDDEEFDRHIGRVERLIARTVELADV